MPEIFGKEEKQYRDACGLPLRKPLQRECCFDERGGENAISQEWRLPLKITAFRSAFARETREPFSCPLYSLYTNLYPTPNTVSM